MARRFGLDTGGLAPADRHVEGVVEMMLDATQHYERPLATERLFGWHASLFPTGRSGMHRITVGGWRDDRTSPMQVVPGPVGRERVHFEERGEYYRILEQTQRATTFNSSWSTACWYGMRRVDEAPATPWLVPSRVDRYPCRTRTLGRETSRLRLC